MSQEVLQFSFSSSLRCYAGRQWFSLNRRAAEVIVRTHRKPPELANHFRTVPFSEESYFQTILANSPSLQINQQDWRYLEFPPKAAHPKILTSEDLPNLVSTPAHFAGKFDPSTDDRILDRLDEFLGVKATTQFS